MKSKIICYLLTFSLLIISGTSNADKQACLQASSSNDKNTAQICENSLSDHINNIDDRSIIHITLANYLIFNNRYSEAESILERAFDGNQKMLENGIFRYNWLRTKGKLYFSKEDFIKALPYFERALEIALLISKTSLIANSYNDLGAAYLEMDKYSDALNWLKRSLVLHNNANDDYRSALTLANIAEIYLILKDYPRAQSNFNLSLESHQANKNLKSKSDIYTKSSIAKVYISLANLHTELNQFSKAVKNLESALYIYEKYHLIGEQIKVMSTLGKVYLKQGNIDQASASLFKARKIENTLENQDNINLKQNLLDLYFNIGDIAHAKPIALKGLKQSKHKNNKMSEVGFLESLANISNQESDYKSESNYLKSLQVAKQELLEEKYNKSKNMLLAEIEFNQQQRKISKLEEQQLVQDLNINKQKYLITIITGLLMVLVAYLFYTIKRKENIKRNTLSDQEKHSHQLSELNINYKVIQNLFKGIENKFICFNSTGKIYVNSTGINAKRMQDGFSSIWDLVIPFLNNDEVLNDELFFEIKDNSNLSNVWIYQLNFLDDLLVCLIIENNEDSKVAYQNAENIKNYVLYRNHLTYLSELSINFPIIKTSQLNPVLAAIKSLNNQSKQNSQVDMSIDNLKFQLVDLMIACVDIWHQSTNKNKIELAEESGLWLISIEDGQLRTRTLNKYMDINKIPDNPRWKKVVKTAHFILSNCDLSMDNRQQLNDKTKQLKQIIHTRATVLD